MRIGIANDVGMAAEALRRVVAGGGHQVLWIARTGAEAVERCASEPPDLVLMDLNMPELDGVEATRRIMAATPCAILVVTGQPQDHVQQVFRALGAGALDVTATPLLRGDPGGGAALLAKIRTIGKLIRVDRPSAAHAPRVAVELEGPQQLGIGHLVAIGASTGGPLAVQKVLSGWRAPEKASIVVVQHIDAHFASQLCRWLGDQLQMPTRVVKEGDSLRPGTVQIARTNDHLVLDALHRLRYVAEPRDYPYRPSVDAFFASVARHWEHAATGVLLTGMGKDGARGLLAMRQAGHATLAQDQATSAVYGMPRAAAELGAAEHILPLDQIGPALRATLGV